MTPVLKIMSRNEILTSIKGNYSATNNKMTGYNPNLGLVNINTYIKFGEILSICSQDNGQNCNSDVNQGS